MWQGKTGGGGGAGGGAGAGASSKKGAENKAPAKKKAAGGKKSKAGEFGRGEHSLQMIDSPKRSGITTHSATGSVKEKDGTYSLLWSLLKVWC